MNENDYIVKDITPQDSVVPIYLIPLTDAELKNLKKVEEEEENNKKAIDLSMNKAKESAISKLKGLGLTDDEIKALTGGV